MSTPTEQQLRDLFAADAAAAPQDDDLVEGALLKVRHQRRVRGAAVTGLVVAVAAIGTGLATGVSGHEARRPPVAAPSHSAGRAPLPTTGSATTPPGGGSSVSTSCIEGYSPAALAGRSFAFDGTVTAIGPAASNRPGVALPLAGVTFRVNQWFRGGSGPTVTVDMDPMPTANSSSDPSVPAYGVGTRLLVSGEPRWGGAPLDAAIAWGCGFTRSYDARTAAEWAAATR
jgi:hypothetical protein